MLTLDQVLDSCAHEIKIIKHLGTKVPEGSLDFRPSPNQRTMLELMQYLTVTGLPVIAYASDKNWDRAPGLSARMAEVTPDNFAEAMDAQLDSIREMAQPLKGRDFENEMTAMPWQAPCTLGEFLVNALIKGLSCYRMQFFLYCKQAGAQDLTSAQCWIGIDPPPAS